MDRDYRASVDLEAGAPRAPSVGSRRPNEDDSRIDRAVSLSLLECDHGVEVHLLDRVEIEDRLREAEEGLPERVDVARRLAAHARQERICPDRLDHPRRI